MTRISRTPYIKSIYNYLNSVHLSPLSHLPISHLYPFLPHHIMQENLRTSKLYLTHTHSNGPHINYNPHPTPCWYSCHLPPCLPLAQPHPLFVTISLCWSRDVFYCFGTLVLLLLLCICLYLNMVYIVLNMYHLMLNL